MQNAKNPLAVFKKHVVAHASGRSQRLVVLLIFILTACTLPTTQSTIPTPTTTNQPPELRAPQHRASLNLETDDVRLVWNFHRALELDEVFQVLAARAGDDLQHVLYTQSANADVTYWFRTQDPGLFHWTVRVMQRPNEPAAYRPISPTANVFELEISKTIITPSPPAVAAEARDFVVFLADGFQLDVYAETKEVGNTVLLFGPDNALYVLNLGGTIRRIQDNDGDGHGETVDVVFSDDQDVLQHAVGMAFDDTGRLYVADSGRISTLTDSDNDGALDTVTPIVEGLPSLLYPFHSNNGIAFGPDGKLYLTVGSTSDHGPLRERLEASILRVNPDGSNLEVFATGFRNPYDLVFTPEGDLFSADNAPDVLNKGLRYLPPEELNHVREGLNYGFPDVFGKLIPAGNTSEPPVVEFYPSVVTSGLTYYQRGPFPPHYQGGIFVAQHGAGTGAIIDRGYNNGYAVVYVKLNRHPDGTYSGDYEDFIQFRRDIHPFGRPVDVTVGPRGNLYVSEFQTGDIYIVSYRRDTP